MVKTEGRRITRATVLGTILVLLGISLAVLALTRIDPGASAALGVGTMGRVNVSVRTSLAIIGFFCCLGGALAFPPKLHRFAPLALVTGALLAILAMLIAAASGRSLDLVGVMKASLRMSTPIALGVLAGIWCERSAVINIAIEGMMLSSAAFGFGFFLWSGNIWLGVLAAILTGGVMALLHAVLSITFKTDQIISGTAINILAVGASGFLRRAYLVKAYFVGETLPIVRIPFLSKIPVIGTLFFEHQPIVYCMIILLIATHIILFYTRWGLRTRAVGEHPLAADTVGIDVIRTRYINVIIGGLIAGLAGAWFSLETVGSFEDLMTRGKGFIALAAMIFGNWTPFGGFLGSLLFASADAIQIKLEIIGVTIPPQFFDMTPYIVTMIVLAGLIGRTTPPAADGKPYEKQ